MNFEPALPMVKETIAFLSISQEFAICHCDGGPHARAAALQGILLRRNRPNSICRTLGCYEALTPRSVMNSDLMVSHPETSQPDLPGILKGISNLGRTARLPILHAPIPLNPVQSSRGVPLLAAGVADRAFGIRNLLTKCAVLSSRFFGSDVGSA